MTLKQQERKKENRQKLRKIDFCRLYVIHLEF